MEDALPPSGHVTAQHVPIAFGLVWVKPLRIVAIRREGLVIPVDEKLLDLAAVRRAVIREHALPGRARRDKPFVHPPVRHVAGQHHGIDALLAEPTKGAFERDLDVRGDFVGPLSSQRGDMDVRDDAKDQVRPSAAMDASRRRADLSKRNGAKRSRPADKEPSSHRSRTLLHLPGLLSIE